MDLTRLTASESDSSATILRLLSEANDPEAWDRATAILTEITNGKDLPPSATLDRASSGGLQQRESSIAASGLDASHETADKVATAVREPAPFSLQAGALARRESNSTEPSSGKGEAAGSQADTDHKPSPYSLNEAAIASSRTLQEAVEKRLQAAMANLPANLQAPCQVMLRNGDPNKLLQGFSASDKQPQPNRTSPAPSTAKPQAASRPQDTGRAQGNARAPGSAQRRQDAIRAQTQAIFSAQAAVKAMDALKAQETGTPCDDAAPLPNGRSQETHRPEAPHQSQSHSQSPDPGTADASRSEAAPKARPASRSQGMFVPRYSPKAQASDTPDLTNPHLSMHKLLLKTNRPQAALPDGEPPQDPVNSELNVWKLLPGQQPPLAALPDDIAAWDTPRLEQMPGRLPEPRFNTHLLHSGSKAAALELKADTVSSAYDSPRAGQPKSGEGTIVEESADGKWPAHVLVQCNGNQGKFLLNKQSMVCTCKLCQTKAAKMGLTFIDMTPTEFERHSGEQLHPPHETASLAFARRQ